MATIDCLPIPEFDLADIPLTPMASQCAFGSPSSVPPGFAKFCDSHRLLVDLKTPLGMTGNSTVFSAISSDSQKYAVKISKYVSRISIEFENRSFLPDSIYLVKSYQVFTETNFSILFMELCQFGDLAHVQFDEKLIWKLVKEASFGIGIIHGSGYLHLDISPSNILYDGKNFKISDFGTLIKIGEFSSGKEGAGPYVSPEIFRDPNQKRSYISDKTDIFSFGVVLLEICSGFYAPRGGECRYEPLRKGEILLGGDLYSCKYSKDLTNLVNWMLKVDPNFRPSASQIYDYASKICS